MNEIRKEEIYQRGNLFFKELLEEALVSLKVNLVQVDHLCFRVSDNESYFKLKNDFNKIGDLLSDGIVSGREISTFKLYVPFKYNDLEVYLLELPSVKEGSSYLEGFEHLEMVIDETFDNFMANNNQLDFITKDINKPVNPDIQVKFKKGKIKFHHQSLEKVIELERLQDC